MPDPPPPTPPPPTSPASSHARDDGSLRRSVQFSPIVNVRSGDSADASDIPFPPPATPPPPPNYSHNQHHHHHHPSSAARERATSNASAAANSSRQSATFDPDFLRRRPTRVATFRTVEDLDIHDADDDEKSEPPPPGWEPGSEPGISHDSDAIDRQPLVWCHITVVEFSLERVRVTHFDNISFLQFLRLRQESWVRCRWISINGLSCDIVQAVGNTYDLHELALEDLMHPRNRTKAEWYPNHAFIVLTLQKIVEKSAPDEVDDGGGGGAVPPSKPPGAGLGGFLARARRRWRRRAAAPVRDLLDFDKTTSSDTEFAAAAAASAAAAAAASPPPPGYQLPRPMQTLQHYHSTYRNRARANFMEHNSSLLSQNLVVMAEQVSIFLTSSNTVISFFASSSQDIERPLIRRIEKRGTILREWCDASLLVQAIIDNIVDLAIPLTQAYAMAIDDIELDVLIKPDVAQSLKLYMCISEINKMLTFLNPIDNMVNVIRDHKTDLSQPDALADLQNPAAGVIVTPMTAIYLGDILDHCIIVTEAMDQLKQAADNLINLIFNRISAKQNDSMKALTVVTIIFLPLTFITGFFGQNFAPFPELERGIQYFWKVATPTAVITTIIVLWDSIVDWVKAHLRRRDVVSMRKNRLLLSEARRGRKMVAGPR